MPRTPLDAAERFLGWALIAGLIILILAIGGGVLLSRREQARAQTAPAPQTPPVNTASSTVHVSIDFADGAQRIYPSLAFRPGMTVADAIIAAAAHPRGPKIESSGSGESFFLKSIDGLTNEGGGEKTRNWQFLVNGKLAPRGAGGTILSAGDHVVWVFRVWEAAPEPVQTTPKP